MAKTKTTIKGRLTMVNSQRQQFKPYLYNLEFDGVNVEIDVPSDGIVERNDKTGEVTLNIEGFKAILSLLADSIDDLHEGFVDTARKQHKIVY